MDLPYWLWVFGWVAYFAVGLLLDKLAYSFGFAAVGVFLWMIFGEHIETLLIHEKVQKDLARRGQELEKEQQARNQFVEDRKKQWVEAGFSVPTVSKFRDMIAARYEGKLRPSLLKHLLDIQSQFITFTRFDPKEHTAAQANGYLQALTNFCVKGLNDYTRLADPRLLGPEPPATTPIISKRLNWGVEDLEAFDQLNRALIAPFKTNYFNLFFTDEIKQSASTSPSSSSKKTEKEQFFAYDTPYFRFFERLTPRMETIEPFAIPEDARFFGQWIIGEPGAGKTTFISTMIAEDLKKVARNEASLFVMDSQNELIPDIARLEMFAPGRPLHGKLIYLEPNPDFPLGLNIFDINKTRQSSLSSSEERMMLQNGVEWMVDFFLSSLVKSDETSRQGTFLTYLIPAILAIPNATVFTLQDLLEPAQTKGGETGYDRYKQHFGGLRENTQKWLRERMHSQELAVTRNAIRDRLEGFVARDLFHDMFKHPHNKLDLFQELQSGKVILVNTKGALLKKNLEPFGRYFIARLLQAAEERMFVERGNRLPVYAYIDEASDYISEEENIEELKNKARKQKVALIIANQMESQITMPLVREALGRMAIQCRGEPPVAKGDAPVWHVSLGKQEPVRVSFPDTQFSKMLRMSEQAYQAMLVDMRKRFSTASTHALGPERSNGEHRDWDAEPSLTDEELIAELEAQDVPWEQIQHALKTQRPQTPQKTPSIPPPKSDLDFG